MRTSFYWVIIMTLSAVPAVADPAVDLQNHYLGMGIVAQDIGRDIGALVIENKELAAKATNAEERLKWVLDNWVSKPKAAQK